MWSCTCAVEDSHDEMADDAIINEGGAPARWEMKRWGWCTYERSAIIRRAVWPPLKGVGCQERQEGYYRTEIIMVDYDFLCL